MSDDLAEITERAKDLFERGQLQQGIDLLKPIWPTITWDQFFLFVRNFDAFITPPLDDLLGRYIDYQSYSRAYRLLTNLEELLDITPSRLLQDVNNLLSLSAAYSRLGIRYFNVSSNDRSLEAVERAISIFSKAIYLLKEVMKIYPDAEIEFEPYYRPLAVMYVSAGKCLGSEEKWAESIPYFQKATELDPENDEAWLRLGDAYFPKVDKSRPYWQRAAELGNTEAMEVLRRWNR